ncbi:hypothetical protein HHK36_025649 [Tetracentron sinense]|uniref:Golgin candidate 5 n=1 Tax=Tetracentron sinense TaxID=13715 RepID=A0A834YLN5_TETSI|nr:hypothetical protein HHK36_025649 [Tetracentron sinense]
MAWLGKVSLGGFPDLAGAVTKLSESVKNIEKNFDSALGLEENSASSEGTIYYSQIGISDMSSYGLILYFSIASLFGLSASGLWSSAADRKALFEPVMAFMGHKGGESVAEPLEQLESSQRSSSIEGQEEIDTNKVPSADEKIVPAEKENEALKSVKEDEHADTAEGTTTVAAEPGEADSKPLSVESNDLNSENVETQDSFNSLQQKEISEVGSCEDSLSVEAKSGTDELDQVKSDSLLVLEESIHDTDSHERRDEQNTEADAIVEKGSSVQVEALDDRQVGVKSEASVSDYASIEEAESSTEPHKNNLPNALHSDQATDMVSESVSHDSDALVNAVEVNQQANDFETETNDQRLSSETNVFDSAGSLVEIEKVKMEMKMMEAALQGAARQSQEK